MEFTDAEFTSMVLEIERRFADKCPKPAQLIRSKDQQTMVIKFDTDTIPFNVLHTLLAYGNQSGYIGTLTVQGFINSKICYCLNKPKIYGKGR